MLVSVYDFASTDVMLGPVLVTFSISPARKSAYHSRHVYFSVSVLGEICQFVESVLVVEAFVSPTYILCKSFFQLLMSAFFSISSTQFLLRFISLCYLVLFTGCGLGGS